MVQRQEPYGKAGKITYWISTMLLLLLTLISWYLRPGSSKSVPLGQVAAALS